MRHIKLMSLCVVAAFALSAMVVSGAQAKRSEHGSLKFPFTNGGAVTLTGELGQTITCMNSEGTGEVTSPTAGTLTEAFTGCTNQLGKKCTSTGASAGTIVSKTLGLETGWISKSKGEVGVALSGGPSGEILFEFECEGSSYTVKGPVAGRLTPINLQNASGMVVAFRATGLTQEPPTLEGGGGGVLMMNGTPASLKQELPIRARGRCKHEGTPKENCKPGQAEVNTIANPVRPEFGRCDKQHKTGKFADANCSALAEPGKGSFEFAPIPG
jgi:hypothetical protein